MTSLPLSNDNDLLDRACRGDKRAVSTIFNLLEDRRPEKLAQSQHILDELHARSAKRSHVLGITGPPGVGKSSLTSRFIQQLRAERKSVGVIAVDPSSRSTGGAILGDRIRFQYDDTDSGIYVRSMASRGDYGGVSDRTFAGSIVLRAGFDVVLIETVGVGQAEADIAALVDTLVLVIQPGSGDMLQFIKSGIMEIPHILIVNKADHVETAQKTLHEMRAALGHLQPRGGWTPQITACSALDGRGIPDAIQLMQTHLEHLLKTEALALVRRDQSAQWIARNLEAMFGSRGVTRWGGLEKIREELHNTAECGPFTLLEKIAHQIESA